MDTPKSSFFLVTIVSLLALCVSGCRGDTNSGSFYDKNQVRGEGPEGSVEEVIDIFTPEDELYLSISLDSSGAVFYRGGEEIGSLIYDQIYYDLANPDGDLIWKMMAHDTKVVVNSSELSPILSIVRSRDRIDFIGQGEKVLFYINEERDGVLLYRVSDNSKFIDEIIATASPTEDGISVSDALGNIKYTTDCEISPFGLVTIMLPEYDILERSAMIIMVK